jgi:hypothetical protein
LVRQKIHGMYCVVLITFLILCKYSCIIRHTVMVLVTELAIFPFCGLKLTSFQFWALFLQAKMNTCKLNFYYWFVVCYGTFSKAFSVTDYT